MLKKVIPVILAVIFLIGAESFAVEEKKGKPEGKATQKQMQQRRQRVAKEIERRLERAEQRAVEIIERAERKAEEIIEHAKREAAGRAEVRGGHPRIERDIERRVRRRGVRGPGKELEIRIETKGGGRCGDVEVEKHFKAMGPESAHMRAGAGKGRPGRRFHKGMGQSGRGMRCHQMGRGMKGRGMGRDMRCQKMGRGMKCQEMGRGMRCHQMGRRMKGRGMGGGMQCRKMLRMCREKCCGGMKESRCEYCPRRDDGPRHGKGPGHGECPKDDDDDDDDKPRWDDKPRCDDKPRRGERPRDNGHRWDYEW